MVRHGARRGQRYTPEYISWKKMNSRCFNANSNKYRSYGAKGITVCDRWRGKDGFAHFFADMGPRPEATTLHRLKNEFGYEPGNCVWATAEVQGREKSTTKLSMEAAQEIRHLASTGVWPSTIAKQFNVSAGAVYSVLCNQTWKDPAYTPKPKPAPRLVEKVPQDPVLHRARQVEYGRRALQSPKYLAHIEALRQDPEYRAKQVEYGKKGAEHGIIGAEYGRRAASDPAWRARVAEGIKKKWADPEFRAKEQARKEALRNDPAYIARQAEHGRRGAQLQRELRALPKAA
jgi:hypothetical protein